MAIDVKHEVNAIERQVGNRTLAAGEARVATITRVYDADLADVWDACTNAERIPRWFMPVTGELKVGGRYQLQGNASGVVERCDPPRGFNATWEFGGEVSWIEVRLADAGDGRTRFELEHVGHVKDEFWDQYGPGATGVGWDLGLLGLSLHLADPAGGRGEDFDEATWGASEEGRLYVSLSSQAWADASVAAGTPEEAARAAQERTTAFYTGG